MRVALRSLAVLLVAAQVGCGGEGSPPEALANARIDTLPDGRVVVNNRDVPAWGAGSPSLVEEFRIGKLDSGGPDMFGEIRALGLGDDGTLFVLDGQASEVRAFGSRGEYIRTLGREGQGPGEFNGPAGMALDSKGILWVMNWRNARYSGFDAETGELVREVRRVASFTSFPWPGAFDSEDRLIDVALDASGETSIIRLDTTYSPVDTMRMPRLGEEHMIAFRRDGVMMMSMLDPFAPRPHWSAWPGGGVVIGEGSQYRLHVVEFSGDTTRTVTLQREPLPVTAAERDSALAAFEEGLQNAENAVPDRRPRVPDTKPAHGPLFPDDIGRLWVRVGEGPSGAWDVFAPDGVYLGQIPMPQAAGYQQPVVRRGRLALATVIDGVPTVIVYSLVGT